MSCEYTIVRFTKEHVNYLRTILTKLDTELNSEKYVNRLTEYKNTAYTVLDRNSDILFSGGIMPLWEGVGQCWTLIPEQTRKNHKFTLHKASKQLINQIQKQYNFHRIQTEVEDGFTNGHLWAKRFGFINEGPMYCYGPDKKTFYRYAIIYP